MIIDLYKNQNYQIKEQSSNRVVVDAFDGSGINRISISLQSGLKLMTKRIIADECVTLYDGRLLKRIQQNLIIE